MPSFLFYTLLDFLLTITNNIQESTSNIQENRREEVEKVLLSASVKFRVQFYEVDSMGVVWHGNYINYMETARCALLNKVGYGYKVMEVEGYVFPVIKLNIKYVRSLHFEEEATITAFLIEYKDCLTIEYKIVNANNETVLKAQTKQVAVKWKVHETQLQSPSLFIKRVEECIKKEKESKDEKIPSII